MNNDNLLQQEDLDVLREQVNALPHKTSEMEDVNAIESLTATRQKIEKVFDDLAASLQARLTLLNEAMKKESGDRSKKSEEKQSGYARPLILSPYSLLLTSALLLAAFVFWQSTSEWKHQRKEQQTIVRPVTETLEAFAARESEHWTADERRKLIAVTEKILSDHFTTPSAMREAFRYERLRAGIDSDAFNIFSDKWATKVEERQYEDTIEAMRSTYGALLRGLQAQAYSALDKESEDRSQESEETVKVGQELGEESNSELLTPDSFLLTPSSVQRLGLLRRR